MIYNQREEAIGLLARISDVHGRRDRQNGFIDWLDAVSRYTGFRKTGILDIACVAANLTLNLGSAEASDLDPLAKQAVIDTNPSFDFASPPTGEALEGAINAAKGKYFEYMVVERLNNGERVGDVVLPRGYEAVLAESPNQPGWDVKIIDRDGRVSEFLQLKASDNIGYVKDALERYPDIQIMTTDEVADTMQTSQVILDSDISDEWLTSAIEETMLENESYMDLFLEAFSPVMSLAVIASTEGLQILVNKKSVTHAISEGVSRSGRSLASQAVAGVIYASGGGWLALPAGIFTRLILERMHDLQVASEIIVRSRIEMIQLRLFQQDQLLLEA